MEKILVVGSINMDLTIHTERIPERGETITGKQFRTSPGGKGSNQAVAAAKLGANVKFLGAVGDDLYGEDLCRNLKNNNVDFSGITAQGVSTGVAVITVCGGDNSIILDAGANGMVTKEVIAQKAELFEWADYVVMQAEIPPEAIEEAARLAKECSACVIFNPAPYKEFPVGIYKNVDIIVPNETEARLMTGITPADEGSVAKAVDAIRAKGVKEVIITLGERGAVYSDDSGLVFVPAVKTKAVDTTAAGDCFIGAFVTMLAEGKSKDEAVRYASKAAAFAVGRRGASDSLPVREDID